MLAFPIPLSTSSTMTTSPSAAPGGREAPPPSSFVASSPPPPPPPSTSMTNIVPTDTPAAEDASSAKNNNNANKSTIGSSPASASASASARAFYETAEYRCLNVAEIVHLLTPSTTPLPVSPAPPLDPPPSGSLFLYDRRKTRNYKHDHHDWVKKPVAASRRTRRGSADSSASSTSSTSPPPAGPPARYRVREDDVKLRHGGECRVAAYYARGAAGTATGSTMRRRTYCLIDPTTLRPYNADDGVRVGCHWVLVHYLDAGEIPRMVVGGGGSRCLTSTEMTTASTATTTATSSMPSPSNSSMVPSTPSPPPPPMPPSSSSSPHRVTPGMMDEDPLAAFAAAGVNASLYRSAMKKTMRVVSGGENEDGENQNREKTLVTADAEAVPSICVLPGDHQHHGCTIVDSFALSAAASFSKGSSPFSPEYDTRGGPVPGFQRQQQQQQQQNHAAMVTAHRSELGIIPGDIDEMCYDDGKSGGGGARESLSPYGDEALGVFGRGDEIRLGGGGGGGGVVGVGGWGGGGGPGSVAGTVSAAPAHLESHSPYGGDALGVFGRGDEIKLGGNGGGGGWGWGGGSGSSAASPVGVTECPSPASSPRCHGPGGAGTGMGIAGPPPPLPATAGSGVAMELDAVDQSAQQVGLLRRASALVDSSPWSRILSNAMQFQADLQAAPKMTEEDFTREWESSTEVEKSEAIEDIYGNAAVEAAGAGGGGGGVCDGGGGASSISPHDSFGSDHGVDVCGGGGGHPGGNEFVNELQGEILEGKLALIEYELDRVSPRDKVGYLEARRLCPQLASSREVKLQFLRCENFCARRAAVRLTNYWTKRVELFGRDRAFLPLTLEGALSGDFEDPCFGHTRLLPGTDASGRGIIFLDYTINGSRTTKLRGLWYMAHAALENESVRRNGFVFIVFTCPPIEHFDMRLITEQQYLMGDAFPLRLRASHICKFETKGWFMPIIHAALKFTAGKYMRSRLVFHDGSTEKVMLQLAEYGISRTQLPTGIGGTYTEEEFQQWLALRREAGM